MNDVELKIISTIKAVVEYGGAMAVWLDKDGNVNVAYAIDEEDYDVLDKYVRESCKWGDRTEVLKRISNEISLR